MRATAAFAAGGDAVAVTFVAPHFGQEADSEMPQVVQNLRSSRLSLPHLGQRILIVGFYDLFGRFRRKLLMSK